jgi:glycyl-tRNA synthetase alpha subunit
VLTMQDALARLDGYWTSRGCLRVQPMNTEVGAGTLNPATFLGHYRCRRTLSAHPRSASRA